MACPDARPPAYEAAAGLAGVGRLDRLVTGFYDKGPGPVSGWAGRLAPSRYQGWRRRLARRSDRRIPAERVVSAPEYDLAIAVENRVAGQPRARRAVARWRTDQFDRRVARQIGDREPSAALVFSDVGSRFALDACRRSGVPTLLSMVHGEVEEERSVLDIEERESPDYLPLYLGDGRLDRLALDWLHARRRRDLVLADRIIVPSDHIARRLSDQGVTRDRVAVIPYGADLDRFRPDWGERSGEGCTFVFAGAIAQRKGIKYLLRAWAKVWRPGWRLQLVGPLPSRLGPLEVDLPLEGVELVGRIGPSEMPARFANADVFVFPSLFEGSAVVTYEALAAGLPSVATSASGTIARDGIEGFLVASRDVDGLADRMVRLGLDPDLRRRMGRAARARAEEFGWPRYQDAVIAEVDRLLVRS